MESVSLRTARAHAYENARPEIQAHVPADARRILDLGCSSGAVGSALKARRAVEVIGVEADPVYAGAAAERLDQVIEADIEALALETDLAERLGDFDCLIAGDVLEHLSDPWAALRSFASLIRPEGTAVISLPNVRFWETAWQLVVRGRWPRRADGIFDRGHLRWFTVADGIDLVKDAGLNPVAVRRLYRLRPSGASSGRLETLVGWTPLRPFLTFQFVIEARRPPAN